MDKQILPWYTVVWNYSPITFIQTAVEVVCVINSKLNGSWMFKSSLLVSRVSQNDSLRKHEYNVYKGRLLSNLCSLSPRFPVGGVLSYRFEWAGGRLVQALPWGTYLLIHRADFTSLKVYGIVEAGSYAVSWPYADLLHMGWPVSKRLARCGNSAVQILEYEYI